MMITFFSSICQLIGSAVAMRWLEREKVIHWLNFSVMDLISSLVNIYVGLA